MDGNELTGRVKGISTKSKADEDGAIEHTTKVGIELKDLDNWSDFLREAWYFDNRDLVPTEDALKDRRD